MDKDKFEQSKTTGNHLLLSQLVGKWQGTTKTWFEPGKIADESPWHGTIRAALDGRFVVYEYEGSLQGKPLQGVAIYGYYLSKGKFESAWVDSFHMGTGIMSSDGESVENGFSVLGKYEDFSGGPPWSWRTEIKVIDRDHIVITAYNISPQGEEAKAVETSYKREN